MRANIALGLTQGLFLPHDRPDSVWLAKLGTTVEEAAPHVRDADWSASAMWAVNDATVSPAPDTRDAQCPPTVDNLMTMPHRRQDCPQKLHPLRIAFASSALQVHGP